LLLVLGLFFFRRKPDVPVPQTVARIPVVVSSDSGMNYRIEDPSGHDLTADAEGGGLTPGSYRLKATRPGFRPVDNESLWV